MSNIKKTESRESVTIVNFHLPGIKNTMQPFRMQELFQVGVNKSPEPLLICVIELVLPLVENCRAYYCPETLLGSPVYLLHIGRESISFEGQSDIDHIQHFPVET